MIVSHKPMPAVWPKGRTPLSAGGPCLSKASWSTLLSLASVPSNEARRGINGFGSFCRNKRASPARAKPGNTEKHIAMLMKINANLDKVSAEIMKLPQEVHS